MPHLLLVMLGGAIGAGCRYGVARLVPGQANGFPWATFIVNLAGGFLAGALIGLLVGAGPRAEPLRLFLGVGVLGGFTTFSAETADMLQRGAYGLAALYTLSVVGAVAMLFLGLWLARVAA